MTTRLIPPDAPEFRALFGTFQRSVFRLETLQSYGTYEGEDETLAAFLAGHPEPPDPEHDAWAEQIAANVRAGKTVQRVHVVIEPVSEYIAYELTWGYAPNVRSGEDVRVIPVPTGRPWPTDLPRRARMEYTTHREQSGSGAADQTRIGRRESKATRIRSYQPGMIPGLLQTPEYTRELLMLPCGPGAFGETLEGIERMVAARVKRQEILYQPGKRLQFVIGEPALRTPPGSAQTLAGQLDRLTTVAGLASVELGIGPLGRPMPVFPLTGFDLTDDDAVLIETLTGEQHLGGADEVEIYTTAFDQLLDAAATGPDAVALIRRIMAELGG